MKIFSITSTHIPGNKQSHTKNEIQVAEMGFLCRMAKLSLKL